MKNLLLVLLSIFWGFTTCNAQIKISILGDSYSTFANHVTPATNAVWYGKRNLNDNGKINDVKKAEDTWWALLTKELDAVLERNNSYSGTTICHTGYDKADYTDRSFITRIHNLGSPDIIFIFGGTNDAWAGVPIGKYKYKKWTREDLFNFRPAFCYLLYQLKQLYPDARIYNISNCGISNLILESMEHICRHYKITNIQLQGIDKQSGHPSMKGMRMICDQLSEVVTENK